MEIKPLFDFGIMRVYQDLDRCVTFSPAVNALKTTLLLGNANNEQYRAAAALMTIAERMARYD